MTDAEYVREIAQPLSGSANDYDSLLELIGDARFVLLAEVTHGKHEFYSERAAITKRLIAEKGFSILAIEATGPIRPEFTVTCGAPQRIRMQMKRFRVFRSGCGATR
jgi:erythromycin esterase-like protein